MKVYAPQPAADYEKHYRGALRPDNAAGAITWIFYTPLHIV